MCVCVYLMITADETLKIGSANFTSNTRSTGLLSALLLLATVNSPSSFAPLLSSRDLSASAVAS